MITIIIDQIVIPMADGSKLRYLITKTIDCLSLDAIAKIPGSKTLLIELATEPVLIDQVAA